jgi:hypothetical protein
LAEKLMPQSIILFGSAAKGEDIEQSDIDLFIESKETESQHDQELTLIEACSIKLLIPKMQGTLVHELGHNFGLRHNFYGSNDVENFYPSSDETSRQIRSSSVMEYPDFNEDRLNKPGLYDIAAIRYGYSDSVLLADSTIIKLNTNQTIEQNVKAANGTLKKYKFCTDDHIFYGSDPMCARHDAGTTPTEVVNHIINDYDTLSSISNYKLDRAYKPTEAHIAWQRESFIFAPLYKFYTEWRVELAQLLGEPTKYLDGLSDADIQNKIQNLASTNPAGAAKLIEYQNVKNIIINFIKKIAMAPSR